MTTTKIMPDEIINTINDALPFEKCFNGGVLPLELFDRIYNTADEMKRREAEEHRLWCEEKSECCDECGYAMTRQQVALSEQSCLAEVELDFFNEETDKHFCGVECREINSGNAWRCACCDQALHDDVNFWGNIFQENSNPEYEHKLEHHDQSEICQTCCDDLEAEWDEEYGEAE
jgi:hypothetical protein